MRSMKLAGLVLLLGCGGGGPQARWEVIEHTCQDAMSTEEVITELSYDQMLYLVSVNMRVMWRKGASEGRFTTGPTGTGLGSFQKKYTCNCAAYSECRLTLGFVE